MAQLTKTALDVLIKDMNQLYQPKSGACVATPRNVQTLLDELEAYTQEVQEAANDTKIVSNTPQGVFQWSQDMATWQTRLGRYQKALDAVPKAQFDTPEGCKAIYQDVTAPLLDGIYYEILPGINLGDEEKSAILAGEGHPAEDVPTPGHPPGHSKPRPPDVGTPFTLGNQVLVYRDHQKERAARFWSDIKAPFRAAGRAISKFGETAEKGVKLFADLPWEEIVVGGVLIVGVGFLIVQAGKKR